MKHALLSGVALAAGLVLVSAARATETDQASCQALAVKITGLAGVRLTSTAFVPEGAAAGGQPGPALSLPAHCDITGKINERTGVNGQAYAIRFHLRLPVNWNQRFLFQGGGGSNGDIGDALGMGAGATPALSQGYAVVSQDSGHDNATNSDPAHNGQVAFGFDPVARADYGHTSLKKVADTAREIIKVYYGRKPLYSYFIGCSKGGQEGMTFATLYPDEFDGILASAPGFSLPRAAVAEAWDVQSFGALAKMPGSDKVDFMALNRTYSDSDLSLVRKAILAGCDKDDGLADGIVGDYLACTDDKVLPQLQAIACADAKTDACLSADQIKALVASKTGPVNSAGRNLYAGWFWPSGIAGNDWRLWKIGSADGRIPALNVLLGGPSLASVFTTPPTVLGPNPQAIVDYQMAFDMDRDAGRIYAVSAPFTTSAWHDIGSRSPDLSAFRKRGGKLMVPHGDSDPVFSLKDTLAWYDEVNDLNGGKADAFVRVFPVPGMCHCGGGQATSQYDAFTVLVSWVEKHQAPQSLLAAASAGSPWPDRQRPICAYPLVARYNGAGDIEKASSFTCKA
ncbi:MAG TPA: tannase/feruloyl esterase family alpha/beta hydrolase [Asticcacaulis sp.]|nr:tannase/feruloyl esterase family alpha/beta hydrolase [Asticcacaulis sp.]